MSDRFKYNYNKESGILFKYYFGQITINDIESSWEYAFKNNLIPEGTKAFILDYRNATFNFKTSEHGKIAAFYRKNIHIFDGAKIAIITDSIKDIVIPSLVQTKDDGYFSRPFTTLKAAIGWVSS